MFCVYVWLEWVCVCVNKEGVYVMCVCLWVCMCACMHVYMYVHTYVCMHALCFFLPARRKGWWACEGPGACGAISAIHGRRGARGILSFPFTRTVVIASIPSA